MRREEESMADKYLVRYRTRFFFSSPQHRVVDPLWPADNETRKQMKSILGNALLLVAFVFFCLVFFFLFCVALTRWVLLMDEKGGATTATVWRHQRKTSSRFAPAHTRVLSFSFPDPPPSLFFFFFFLPASVFYIYIYYVYFYGAGFVLLFLLLPPPLLQPLLRELMDSIRLSLSLVSVFFSLHLSEVSF